MDEKKYKTEAELQIERLKKLKKEKEIKKSAHEFIETKSINKKDKKNRKKIEYRIIKLERKNFEDLHKVLKNLKIKHKLVISKGKFVNLLLKEFLQHNISWETISTKEDLENLFTRIFKNIQK